MKIYKLFIAAIILLSVQTCFAQNKFVGGVNAHYLVPSGTLSDRFKPVIGYSAYFGREVSETWTWTGNIEYALFDKANTPTKLRTEDDLSKVYLLPEKYMELKLYGLTANASYKVYENSFMDASLKFGFGFYRWEYERDAINAPLFVEATGTTDSTYMFSSVSNTQEDWSGGFNVGFNANFNIYEGLYFHAGADYKIIVGEMWAALALNLENVSTFQMYNLTAGIRYRF